jgi:hypothetical protein
MSSASNMGYGGTSPYSGINANLVNSTNSNYSGGLGSTQVPSSAYSMRGASNNIDAAAGRLSGGGGKGTKYYKLLKRKIKNITKRYKMRGKNKRTRITRMKRKIRSSSKRTRTRTRTRTRSRRMRGGSYPQFGSNVAQSANYSVGGILNAGSLGLANPPPIQMNAGSCQDNANHFKLGR